MRKFSQYIAKIGGKWEWLFFPGYYIGFVFLARKYPPNVLLPSGYYYTEQTKSVTTAMFFGINPIQSFARAKLAMETEPNNNEISTPLTINTYSVDSVDFDKI
ncbi:MAG: hypothetical protein O6848_07600 [Bacteroidetes bacterium]|nr:hypothetical protein [Bacteroidota bacterium]